MDFLNLRGISRTIRTKLSYSIRIKSGGGPATHFKSAKFTLLGKATMKLKSGGEITVRFPTMGCGATILLLKYIAMPARLRLKW